MKPKEKKKYLAKMIELLVQYGHDITPFMGKPLSFFDFEKVKTKIGSLEKENQILQ